MAGRLTAMGESYPTCPECGWEDTAGYFEAHAGTEIECESCGAIFVVTETRKVTEYECELKKPRPEVEKSDPKDDPLIRKLKEPSEDVQFDV
jgi:predicted RNA-binding Zn-ribbon protein involved in translation (DUF1610 family)